MMKMNKTSTEPLSFNDDWEVEMLIKANDWALLVSREDYPYEEDDDRQEGNHCPPTSRLRRPAWPSPARLN